MDSSNSGNNGYYNDGEQEGVSSSREEPNRLNDSIPEDDSHRQIECSSISSSDVEAQSPLSDQGNESTTIQSPPPSVNFQQISPELLIRPSFPPKICPKDLVINLLRSKSRSPKMLNEFFIYRKAYVEECKKHKLRPKMTKVSSSASVAWHNEPPAVKDEYRRLARETENLYLKEIRQRSQSTTSKQVQPPPSPQPPIVDDVSPYFPLYMPIYHDARLYYDPFYIFYTPVPDNTYYQDHSNLLNVSFNELSGQQWSQNIETFSNITSHHTSSFDSINFENSHAFETSLSFTNDVSYVSFERQPDVTPDTETLEKYPHDAT
ncbi:1528_t:CDS:1 [Acaulospora morrowiae]|uniref:1528_t:CDS:1 n=1 Tax=Acaulospora morrowiae TaxID=94023 RepID=A0A9N9DTE9_9GLOM|nr:1528_t:CDS:1 [Acaulospora morrowiae]